MPENRFKRKCPSCEDQLLWESTRRSIDVEYCPKCLGIWLDRDELEKIVRWDNRQRKPINRTNKPIRFGSYKSKHSRKPKSFLLYLLKELLD